ncbi:MAG TPA: CRISPR-associated protein Cas4 [Rhodanobacteraceae bacterium]
MAVEPLVQLSALQHWGYCPRQCALIHIEQVFSENAFTARGRAAHKKVDEPGAEHAGTTRLERAMPLWNDTLGLIGKADLVEFAADGTPYPVEYKHGHRHAQRCDELQLAGQALCLEAMTGKPVPAGAIYHFSSRRRREVMIDNALREQTLQAIAAVRMLLAQPALPPPVNDVRCRHCSLRELCQPAVVADRRHYQKLLDELHGSNTP